MIRVDGKDIDWREGMTVADVLQEIGDGHNCPVVRLNGKFVTRPHFADAEVPDKTEVHLLHLVAGG